MLHPLSAACLQLWDTLLCEVVDETVSAYAQAHAARPTPLPPASQELLEGWTPEQTRAAAASSAVRDVLELEASALSARKPSQAATAQLEDVFGNRPKQGADTIVCTNCKSEVSSNRCARMPKATDPRYPEAPATSPSGLDTPRQRHESQRRAASRLGQPRPAGWWAFWLAGRPQRPCLPRIVCIHRWEGEREGDAAQRDGVRRRLLRAAVHGPHHAQPHRAARAAQPRHNGPASYATGGSNPGPAAVGPAGPRQGPWQGPRQGPWQGPRQGPKAGLLRTRASLPLCRQPCRVLPQQPPRGMGRQAAGRRARRAARSDLARPRGHGGRRPRELHRAPTPTLAGALAEPTRPAH